MKLFFAVWMLGVSLFAEVVVIVNIDNDVEVLSANDIKRIYMGKTRYFPNGDKAAPIDLKSSDDTFKTFYKKVTGKSVAAINKYRARRNFAGKGSAPRSVESSGEVIAQVKNNRSMIGYLDRIDVTDDVKVVYTIK